MAYRICKLQNRQVAYSLFCEHSDYRHCELPLFMVRAAGGEVSEVGIAVGFVDALVPECCNTVLCSKQQVRVNECCSAKTFGERAGLHNNPRHVRKLADFSDNGAANDLVVGPATDPFLFGIAHQAPQIGQLGGMLRGGLGQGSQHPLLLQELRTVFPFLTLHPLLAITCE